MSSIQEPEVIAPTAEALSALSNMKRKIGMIRLWPEQAAAEHESIERYRFACSLLGVEIVELDRLGFLLKGPRRRVTQDDVDFVISLHFETPKAFDCFSWAALWNPVDFYVDWGFDTFVDHQFTHDGYFTCGSKPIERMARSEIGDRFDQVPTVNVNHTLSGPVFRASLRDDRRLVYCGINWERLNGKPGRFDHLLKPLDDAEVLDVFGPTVVQNVRVWEGFQGYKREVPFDGKSLIGEIAQSGAVLALSSNAHLRSGVMTSRLFEGAAAGALVFADANSFVRSNFADETVPIDITGDPEKDAGRIAEALRHYNAYPDEAYAKADALQQKYIGGYMLHNQLLQVYARYQEHLLHRTREIRNTKEAIGYLILWPDQKLNYPEKLIRSIEQQTHGVARIRLLTIGRKPEQEASMPTTMPGTDLQQLWFEDAFGKPNAFGAFIMDAIDGLPEDVRYISVLNSGSELFRDYAAQLSDAAATSEVGAVSSMLNRHYDPVEQPFTGIEYIDLWRPRLGQSRQSNSIDNMLLRRDWLVRQAGAIQMMEFNRLVEFINDSGKDMNVCDTPLVWSDLKVREREHRLALSPYTDDSIFHKRYGRQLPASAAAEVRVIQGPVQEDGASAFLGRNLVREKRGSLQLVRSLRQKWLLSRARKAARALEWSTAEYYYAELINSNGADPRIWKQLGHALKEQGQIEPARYCYNMAVSLQPDDGEARQHLSALAAKG
jgi:hypothetical protein